MDTKFWKKQFKNLRLSNGWTQNQMAQKLGVSQSLINLLESGKRNFTQSLLDTILERLNITLYEFMFEDNMETPTNAVGEIRETSYMIQTVPLIEWDQIGTFMQDGQKSFYSFNTVHTPKSASNMSFALTVKDDTMQPRFMQDDKIIVDPARQPENNDACIIRINENYDFKIYSKEKELLKLDVFNKKYPYTCIPDESNIDYEIIGKVIGLIAKF